jgi:hypothetical protein
MKAGSSSTLVSTKCSAPLIRCEPVELEVGRQAATEFPEWDDEFGKVRFPGNRESLRTSHLNLDLVGLAVEVDD